MRMAMRGLVEPDCGGVNPLVRLTNRYTADRARVVEGVGSSTSRDAAGEVRVSSQGLVRQNSFCPFPYFSSQKRFGNSWRRRGRWLRGRLTLSGWIPSSLR